MQANPKQQGAKIILYWLDRSRSQRILWLLEELKLEYELKTYKRQPILAPEELEKIHPLGKSPIVSVEAEGMTKPLVIAESGLIVEYLIDHFGPHLAPAKWIEGKEGRVGGETEEYIRYKYFMHYAEGTLMMLMVASLLVGNINGPQVPWFIRPVTSQIASRINSMFLSPNFKTNFDFLESQLATSPKGGKYLCGKELSGADIMMVFPLGAARTRAGLSKEKYPLLFEYISRLEEFDSNKRAVEKIVEIKGSYDANL
ncbi:hypothetical protein MMC13_004108 [Lambiella insularis]|nr:hypothetical protein [Lambiella insularis]